MIPVGHAERRVAPLGLGRTLNRPVAARLDPDHLPAGLEVAGRGPARRVAAVEVLDEAQVAGGVSADQVLVPVAVPVEGEGGDEGTELDLVGLLLEVTRAGEARGTVDEPSGVFDVRDTAVLLPHHQVAVAVPVEGHGHDHLEVEVDHAAVVFEEARLRVPRVFPIADVLKIAEAVEELPAHDVEVAGLDLGRRVVSWLIGGGSATRLRIR